MINGLNVMAIIPARGGSKRCPRKNLKLFRGKSLIEWSFIAAQQSELIDTVYCSTEDAEIKAHALQFGLVIDRPAELATDSAMNEDVMRHALEKYEGYGVVVLLQPTSPLRNSDDIDSCIKIGCIQGSCYTVRNTDELSKNGAVYVATEQWLREGRYFSEPCDLKVVMPRDRSLDIDYPQQFEAYYR
jgi:CMP-N-acetylneuraminic acid synthetase